MHNQGIGSWPARRARRTPDRIAVVHEGHQVTYRELHERVLRLAHALRGLGVGRGDRVAYLGPNHPAFLETLFAAGALGAVFVPLNTRLAVPELAFNLSDSGTSVLVHAPSETAEALDVPHRVPLDGYERLISGAGPEPVDEPVSPSDPCMIMYTSGTTGRPKGAVLSHANITWNSVNILIDADLAADEVTLVVAPLFHTAGLNMTCLPTLLKGGRVVLLGAFDPGRVLELIESERVTHMFGVPTMFDAMAAHPRWGGTDLASLRTLNCGGAPVPMRTIEVYLERGLAFSQGYGMTEASPGVLLLPPGQAVAKAGSAGVPHFFTDVRVVRSDGRDAAPGEKGEIAVQGPNVMTGYWGAQPLARGEWLRTGDVAQLDEDGYAYIVDRVKDMFVSGGENVYPAEVEKAILDHPAVADCAVIGVPDATWGEVGRAVVVLRPDAGATADDLLGFLRGRLAAYKIPKSVVWADALPRNPSGKILKPEVRASYTPPTPTT
ncbi:acyl-CoA synthetase [Planomonospora venezuelensis]|uniref:Fatty-acyl-CoA synthase n=1 Tax=Planomonospora venezuelensis TaxID=1999 RepID=A0A841D7X2_PLAVE|nr:long-chain fatty acid--CoA ligase [Planomonospora venezuelensis]MBB5965569.1 fatty-acyl-CoA synthase [Planomonospora venezuelensis]GIN02630.1 fatty-acyl-CoA synthase [Planomonospora venezuelensis]